MDFIKSLFRIISSIIRFIWNAIWIVICCIAVAAYGYTWWVDYQYEKSAEERAEFMESSSDEFRNQGLDDLPSLLSDYKSKCINQSFAVKELSGGDRVSLCDSAANILLSRSQESRISLDSFSKIAEKLCIKENSEDDGGKQEQEETLQFCQSTLAPSAINESIKLAITLALCDFKSARLSEGPENTDDYTSWTLSKRGEEVYENRDLSLNCESKKFVDSERDFGDFFDQTMTEDEQYPNYQIIEKLWPALDNNSSKNVLRIIQEYQFGLDQAQDKAVLDLFVDPENSSFLPTVLEANGGKVNFQTQYYDSALNNAISYENEKAALTLLAAGADPLRPNTSGATPISSAAGKGMINLVKELLKAGADSNGIKGAENARFGEPLSNAAEGGHKAIVAILLKNGAKTQPQISSDFPDWSKYQLANAAIYGGNETVLKALVLRGASIDTDGDSVVAAVFSGSSQSLVYLFEQGVRMPEQKDHDDLYRALSQHFKNNEESKPAEANKILEILLNKGLDLSKLSKNGSSYAHNSIVHFAPNNVSRQINEASQKRYKEKLHFATRIVEEVIKSGIDINQVDGKGETMLMHAADRSHPSLVALLLSKGANAELRNNKGLSALDITIKEARRWTKRKDMKPRFVEIIKLLGGDPSEIEVVK